MGQAAESIATAVRANGWLLSLIEMMPQMIWRADSTGLSTWNSPQLLSYIGQTAEEARGTGWLQAIHPDDIKSLRESWQEGRHSGCFDVEVRLRSYNGRYSWFQTRAKPIRSDDGSIIEWIGTSTDIDDLRQLQSRQAVLVAELQHRTRNLIGVIHSICLQTLKRATSLEQFQDAFETRLAALSRVQGLLSKSQCLPITIKQLIDMELQALGDLRSGSQVTVTGPDIILLPSTVQTLALAVHELATNAIKHGALAESGGSLDISWHQFDEGQSQWLCLIWYEAGINVAPQPSGSASGYGRVLIEEALPKQLGARTRLEFQPDVLRCIINMPITHRIT